MMDLQGNFMLYVLVFWLSGMAAASSALLLGCAAANAEVAAQASGAIFVPQLLFAGFYIPVEQSARARHARTTAAHAPPPSRQLVGCVNSRVSGELATSETSTPRALATVPRNLLLAARLSLASRSPAAVPVWMRWVQYICSLKYAMNLFIIIEFGADTRAGWNPAQQARACALNLSAGSNAQHRQCRGSFWRLRARSR